MSAGAARTLAGFERAGITDILNDTAVLRTVPAGAWSRALRRLPGAPGTFIYALDAAYIHMAVAKTCAERLLGVTPYESATRLVGAVTY